MQRLDDYRLDFERAMQQIFLFKRHQVDAKSQQKLSFKPVNLISHFKQRLLDYQRATQQSFINVLNQNRQILGPKRQKLNYLWRTQQNQRKYLFNAEQFSQKTLQILNERFALYKQKLIYLSDLLKAIDPHIVLQKGYGILFAEKEPFVINSIAKLREGQKVKVLLSDGEAIMTINEVIPHG